jgi:TIR domain
MDPAAVTEPEGAWIFLSHSNNDWFPVREIRNVLEARGHRPLMFFLKCLNDHTELHDLIRREIEARTWFLLCDSQAARRSRWVREEMELIRSIPGKYSETVNLDRPLASQLDRIDALCRRATVYLSYARDDTKVQAGQLIDALNRYDYHLRGLEWDMDFDNVQGSIQRHVDDALAHGFVVLLLSPQSAKKEYVRAEIEYALAKAAKDRTGLVVPVVFGNPEEALAGFSRATQGQLRSIGWIPFDGADFQAAAANLVAELKNRPIAPYSSQG